MDMDVVFLGTGGSVPTARRSTACVLARVGGERLLFDCGEGSQRQMQRSTGLVPVDAIYVTHGTVLTLHVAAASMPFMPRSSQKNCWKFGPNDSIPSSVQ